MESPIYRTAHYEVWPNPETQGKFDVKEASGVTLSQDEDYAGALELVHALEGDEVLYGEDAA